MTANVTKPELAAAVKENFGLEIEEATITDEMFESATRSAKGTPSMRQMASRIRFFMIGKKKEASVEKEMIPEVTGTFVGSRDIASKNVPLGTNKSSSTLFLKKCDDEVLRVFTDPNTPSDFGRVKESLFGNLVTVDMELSPNKYDGFYVSAKNQEIVEKNFQIDTSMVEAYDINSIGKVDDYSDCALVGTIRAIRLTRVPTFNQSLINTEDYPMFVGGVPIFTVYLESEDGEPVVKCHASMRHLSKMFVDVEDFEELFDEELFDTDEAKTKTDDGIEYEFNRDVVDEMGDYMDDEVTPSMFGRKVIFFGTKSRDNDVTKENDDGEKVTTTFVDFEIAGMIDVAGEPRIVEVKSAKDKVKDAKEAKKAAKAGKSSKKKNADVEAKRKAARMELIEVAITAMKQETTVDIVRKMSAPEAFKGVEDEVIAGMISEKMAEMGIEVPEETPEEVPEEEPAKEAPAKTTEKEAPKDIWETENEEGEE